MVEWVFWLLPSSFFFLNKCFLFSSVLLGVSEWRPPAVLKSSKL